MKIEMKSYGKCSKNSKNNGPQKQDIIIFILQSEKDQSDISRALNQREVRYIFFIIFGLNDYYCQCNPDALLTVTDVK